MLSFGKIKTRAELGSVLGLSSKSLSYILYVKKPESYYNTFEIPKKSGGVRTIYAPSGVLKALQKKLARIIGYYQENVINKQSNRQSNISHGFEKHKSIITNAKIHRNKRYVVNIDLENFFDSFHIGRVIGYFEKNKNFLFPHEVAVCLGQMVCREGRLPQGAPTSPIITNLICQVLDFRILHTAKKYKMDFTRYADDLTFSTNHKDFLSYKDAFLKEIADVIQRAGFTINQKKTRIQYKDSRQEVTGLVVNKKLSVKREYVRKTRAMAHELYKTGQFMIDAVPGTLQQLEGRFTFINQLDHYDNIFNPETQNRKNDFNSRENQYRFFLFYKYFFANDKPLIVTEGKTDILYLKAAFKALYKQYPQLIERNADGKFKYKVSFFSRTKRLQYFLHIRLDGADTIGNIYKYFSGENINQYIPNYYRYFTKTIKVKQKNPVMLLFDNELESGKKPLAKFLNIITKDMRIEKKDLKDELQNELKIKLVSDSKLFLITNPLMGEKSECEIEDLFSDEVLAIKIKDKTFNRNANKDDSLYYGKYIFSNYVYDNYKSIDFSNFKPLLDAINFIVVQEGYHAE